MFIAFLLVYALLRKSTRVGMLLYVVACSLGFFYLANGWLMLLLPSTALVSWGLTRWMSRRENGARKFLLFLSVVINLAPLIYYKYTNFSIEVFNQILQTNFAFLDIALPVGISFYTFQAISFSTDVYRRNFPMDVSLLEYLFYISFFPLLLAGPITRPGDFFPQIRRRGAVSERLLYLGVWLVMCGLVKKAVVADYIAQYNNWIFDSPETYSGFENLMGVLGYTVQIYCDFSGYSDMAIGLGKMLGFEFLENFNYPYISKSVTEFWRRWHMSLGSWFRDYVYFPLGGSRVGKLRLLFNIFTVWMLTGFWHGADWTFIIWGLYFAVLLIPRLSSMIIRLIPSPAVSMTPTSFADCSGTLKQKSRAYLTVTLPPSIRANALSLSVDLTVLRTPVILRI